MHIDGDNRFETRLLVIKKVDCTTVRTNDANSLIDNRLGNLPGIQACCNSTADFGQQ